MEWIQYLTLMLNRDQHGEQNHVNRKMFKVQEQLSDSMTLSQRWSRPFRCPTNVKAQTAMTCAVEVINMTAVTSTTSVTSMTAET